MTLKELRKLVNDLPTDLDNCKVILQIDPEGNGYAPVRGIDYEAVASDPENFYESEVYSLDYSAEDNGLEEGEWEKLKSDKEKRVLIVFP